MTSELCPGGKVNGTDKRECVCGQGFKLNPSSLLCDLEPVCGKGGTKTAECSAKNALCLVDLQTPGQYKCDCPYGTEKLENGKCGDLCTYR